MSRVYSEPIMEIRKYRLTDAILTDSDPGLHDGDEYDLDSVGEPTPGDSIFAD